MTDIKYVQITCPECGIQFPRTAPRKVFCTPAHQRLFHNRSMVRGKVLLPLALVSRTDPRVKGKTDDVAKYARREMTAYLASCIREDRKAGRDPRALVAQKLALGWRAVDLE